MACALMAWVWIGLTLARLNNAGGRAPGHVAGHDEPLDAPKDWTDRSFRAPVWYFLQGSGKSPETTKDFNQPQYRCSNGTLFLRISLFRYSNLRLEDGSRLLTVPDRCHSSVHIYKWWLLVKLGTGCHSAIKTRDGSGFHPLRLQYFDRLLQENTTGTAVCENSAISLETSPLVTCRTTRITVMLPRGTKLRKVKELDSITNKGFYVRQRRGPGKLFVEISKFPDRDSGFELVYVDSTGKLCTMLAACSTMLPKNIRRRHVRSLEEPGDFSDLWGFEDIPTEPFDPETTPTTQPTTAGSATDAPGGGGGGGDDGGDDGDDGDGGMGGLWGFEEIPEGPFDGVDIVLPGATTVSAATTVPPPATTEAPLTTTTPFAATDQMQNER